MELTGEYNLGRPGVGAPSPGDPATHFLLRGVPSWNAGVEEL